MRTEGAGKLSMSPGRMSLPMACGRGGSPGGVFTPTLFLGAALGGLVGGAGRTVAPWLVSGPLTGGYALVGMACLVAATTHAPLMATALVFEFTGDASLLPPLMIATAIATLVGRRLRPHSIYTEELERRGIPWGGNLAERLARTVRARDILQMDPPQVAASAPLDEALTQLEHGNTRAVYVLDEQGVRVIDLHAAKTLWAARSRGELVTVRVAGDIAHTVPTATPDDTMVDLSEKLWTVDWGEIPVVAPDQPSHLLGIVTRRDLLGAFDREVLQRDVLVTRVVWFEGQRESADFLELPRGQRVELIAPPPWLVGRPLDLAEVHAHFRVMVLAVRVDKSDAPPELQEPDSDHSVAQLDRLLVKGNPEDIDALRHSRLGDRRY